MEEHQHSKAANCTTGVAAESAEGGKRRTRKRRYRGPSGRNVSQVFETIESAAAKLGLDGDALRARCRRAARSVHDATVANLGGGIVAFKFGKSWRIRFPAV